MQLERAFSLVSCSLMFCFSFPLRLLPLHHRLLFFSDLTADLKLNNNNQCVGTNNIGLEFSFTIANLHSFIPSNTLA